MRNGIVFWSKRKADLYRQVRWDNNNIIIKGREVVVEEEGREVEEGDSECG